MKTMLKKLRKMWLGGALLGLAACSEPYQQAVNPDAQPAVVLAAFRDANSFNLQGALPISAMLNLDVAPQDVIVPSNSADSPDYSFIVTDGTAAAPPANMTITPADTTSAGNLSTPARPAVVYPFQAPRIEFNKLINGDTVEQTSLDKTTGRQLGKCVMVPGALTLNYTPANGAPAGAEPSLQACYSPSDYLVTTTAAEADGTPKSFLQYSSVYTLATGSELKDKQNKVVTPYKLNFTTGPFELLYATDFASAKALWYAADTGLQKTCKVDTDCGLDGHCDPRGVCAKLISDKKKDPQIISLVFSGPIAPVEAAKQPDPAVVPPVYDTDPSVLLNTTATVFQIDDETGIATEVATGTQHAYFGIQTAYDVDGPDVTDPRILLIYHPDLIASGGKAKTGFVAGHYRVALPVSADPASGVSDDGTVNADGSQAQLACADGSGGTSGVAATCTTVNFDFYVGIPSPPPASP